MRHYSANLKLKVIEKLPTTNPAAGRTDDRAIALLTLDDREKNISTAAVSPCRFLVSYAPSTWSWNHMLVKLRTF